MNIVFKHILLRKYTLLGIEVKNFLHIHKTHKNRTVGIKIEKTKTKTYNTSITPLKILSGILGIEVKKF